MSDMSKKPFDKAKLLHNIWFGVRIAASIGVIVFMWFLFSLPGEKEHQLYLVLSLALFFALLTAANIMWYLKKD